MKVTLIQFVRPDGRQREVAVEVDDALREQVEAIEVAGLQFTAEVIPGGVVSLCIENGEDDLAIELAENGPGENSPTVALERLIRGFVVPQRKGGAK